MPKRWVSWAAVSSLPQAKKISLEDQKTNNLAAIEKHGGVLVEHLEVPGKSRNIILFEDACERIPAYARLYELIRAKAFDVLVYLDRSRLGRRATLSMTVVELCQDAGIVCYELEAPPASLDAPEERSYDEMLIGAVKSTGYQREIMKISHRHKMGMIARTQDGKFPNSIPWGWVKSYHANGLTYDIFVDEQAAEAIRLVFSLYLERGFGVVAVAEEMNRQGYVSPKGGVFTDASIENIVSKPWRYAGYTEINRESPKRPYVRAKGEFPAIISDELAQAVEGERQRRAGERRSPEGSRFSRVVWCAECNAPMYHGWSSSSVRGKRYRYPFLRCDNKHPNRTIYEARVADAIRATLRAGAAQAPANAPEKPTPAETAAQTVVAQIERIAGEIERLRESLKRVDHQHYVLGTMSADRYEVLTAEIQSRIAGLEMAIGRLQDEAARVDDERQRAERAAEFWRRGMGCLDSADIQAANAFFRVRVRVYVRAGQVEQVVTI